jgi:hypothetical protein
MKKPFNEEQIVGVLKEAEAGLRPADARATNFVIIPVLLQHCVQPPLSAPPTVFPCQIP